MTFADVKMCRLLYYISPWSRPTPEALGEMLQSLASLHKHTQQTQNLKTTSYQCRCDVMTSIRWFDVMCLLGSFRKTPLIIIRRLNFMRI